MLRMPLTNVGWEFCDALSPKRTLSLIYKQDNAPGYYPFHFKIPGCRTVLIAGGGPGLTSRN